MFIYAIKGSISQAKVVNLPPRLQNTTPAIDVGKYTVSDSDFSFSVNISKSISNLQMKLINRK
jgi:hypothetical protein